MEAVKKQGLLGKGTTYFKLRPLSTAFVFWLLL